MIGSQKEFDELKKTGGKGAQFYKPFEKLFNPEEAWTHPYNDVEYFFKAVYYLVTAGFSTVKQALVSGQYYFQEGIYFGGHEQQESTKFLIDLFENQLGINKSSELIVIDVHSGLGPEGKDTLLVPTLHYDSVYQIYGKSTKYDNSLLNSSFFIEDGFSSDQSQSGKQVGDVSAGYQYAVGELENIFKITKVDKGIFVTQEFGTVKGVFVLKGLVEENAAWRFGNEFQKSQGSQANYNGFMVEKASFKKNVVERGITLIRQSLDAFQNEEALEDMPSNLQQN